MFLMMSQIIEPHYETLREIDREGPVWSTERGWWLPVSGQRNSVTMDGYNCEDVRMRIWENRFEGTDV